MTAPQMAFRGRRHPATPRVVACVGAVCVMLASSGCSTVLKSPARTEARPVRPATSSVPTNAPPPRPVPNQQPPIDQLDALVSNEAAATGVSHGTRDDLGHPLDTLKVIDGPRGVALGIYHFSGADGVFTMAIATSSGLATWTSRTVLATHASQPTMSRMSDGSYVVAAEADDHGLVDDPSRWVRFWHYPSLEALLGGRADRTFDAPRTLGGARRGAEGTPSIYSATPSEIRVGFHYLAGRVDREGVGVLRNFAQWTTSPDTALDAALDDAGAHGKHGDRDCVSIAGRQLLAVEAQQQEGSAWEVYLYDRVTQRARFLPITTPEAATAFANPSLTVVTTADGRALVTTLFVPLSGASPNEAGELVMYRTLPASSSVGSCA